MNPYFLFLDDQRRYSQIRYPESVEGLCLEVVEVKDYSGFVDTLEKRGLPQFVSLDHDLGVLAYREGEKQGYSSFDYSAINNEKTGLHCAKYLVDYCEKHKKKLPKWFCHSMNPVGRQNITLLLKKYEEKQNATKN